jgi:hypothetical protein
LHGFAKPSTPEVTAVEGFALLNRGGRQGLDRVGRNDHAYELGISILGVSFTLDAQ